MGSNRTRLSGAFFDPDILKWRSGSSACIEGDGRLQRQNYCNVALISDGNLMFDRSGTGISGPNGFQLERRILIFERKNFLRWFSVLSFWSAVHLEFPMERSERAVYLHGSNERQFVSGSPIPTATY